jgi:phage regulator Rha-like protein
MNEPMTPEQFTELKEKLQQQVRERDDKDLTTLSQKREDTWNSLSHQDQQRLTQQLRKTAPHTADGNTKNQP